MRNMLIIGFLFILIIISFLAWGAWFEEMFSGEKAVQRLQSFGQWAWAFGLLLLVGDLFLPLPATLIMSALGYIYGPIAGGLLATLGSVMAGLLAYGLCRGLGKKGALFILGEKDFTKGNRLFNKNGGWIVAISRWLPIVPEIVTCMAGLNQMHFRTFIVALICGSFPLGFVFAYIGFTGNDYPVLAVSISAILPLALWIVAQYFMRKIIYAKSH